MPYKKILIYTAPLLILLVVGFVYFSFYRGKLKVEHPISRDLINNFSSAFYQNLKLKYPKNYAVQDYSSAFRVLTVSKTDASLIGKIELFHNKDVGTRTETAQAKEQYTLGSNDNPYTILLYYPDNDSQTQSELHQIYNSIQY